MIYFAYALVALCVFLVSHMLFQEEETRAAAENLEDLRHRKSDEPFLRLTRPFFNQYLVPTIRGKASWDEKRKIYKRKIVSAGLRDDLTPDEFIAFKTALIIVFPLIAGLLTALEILDLDFFYIGMSGVLGWFYPDFWINARIRKRQDQILKSLPFVVDLLALSTEAGLDFIGSIARVVEKSKPSPLIDELEQVLKEIKVGSSRADALRELSVRVNMQEINSFIAILISSDSMGASIGKILRQQSEQVRTERMLRAEKAGAAATQKLMFPIMFIIVPAVFLMIGAPYIVNFFGGSN